ncbi:uncharacterized protein LOC117259733 isoform X2 [Epinephelus lanceolatus]
MSVELQHASEPGGNNASLQGTMLGGSKPLHRFMQGQPKITGIVVLILGSSFFIFCTSMMLVHYNQISPLQPGIVLAILYLVCGSLYIVTENKPTKKTVTMSLALSIVSLLASCWIIFLYLPNIIHNLQRVHLDEDIMVATDDGIFPSEYEPPLIGYTAQVSDSQSTLTVDAALQAAAQRERSGERTAP